MKHPFRTLLALPALLLAFALTAAPLQAKSDSGNVTTSVGRLLEEGHYTHHPLNDEISRKLLTGYLEILDFSHLFFTQKDIDAAVLRKTEAGFEILQITPMTLAAAKANGTGLAETAAIIGHTMSGMGISTDKTAKVVDVPSVPNLLLSASEMEKERDEYRAIAERRWARTPDRRPRRAQNGVRAVIREIGVRALLRRHPVRPIDRLARHPAEHYDSRGAILRHGPAATCPDVPASR